jgi:cbb3-type cytochrome oxidase cytochrome c subunit
MNVTMIAWLVGGALLCGFAATVALPNADPAMRAPTERFVALNAQERHGRDIYVRENCVACHTQQVRQTESRFGVVRAAGDIGEESHAGDYLGQNPATLGTARIGPDLARVGARVTRAGDLVAQLRDPATSGGRVHGYTFLRDEELRDLAAYLLSLR